MTKRALRNAISLICLVTLTLTACQAVTTQPVPTQPSMEDLAMTAAIATMTAMPTATPFPAATDTPVPTPTITTQPTITPTPTPAAFGPSDFPTNVNPLTGLVVRDPKVLERRPVAIKVSNYPRSGRPHAGLSAADIVFEYFVGVGTNRFLAFFYGEDAPKAGPIRSGRLADAQLVPMYEGILGYSGAYVTITEKILTALGNRAIIYATNSCPAICRDDETVTGVFANTKELSLLANKTGVSNDRQNLDGMAFDPKVPEGGEAAEDIIAKYSHANIGEWKYDKVSSTYLRWIEDEDANGNIIMIEQIDRNNKKQIANANVVIMYANYIEFAPTLHDITLNARQDGQRMVLFRDGKAFEGTWKSGGTTDPFQFFDANGEPMKFKPGNSWIVIMGNRTKMEKPEAGKWEATFFLP